MNEANPEHPILGWHWFADFLGCEGLPDTPHHLETILVEAALLSGATVVQSCFHQFAPYGLSGVVVIAESHVAAHTWPEHNAMCVDFFSCSRKINVEAAIEHIELQVKARSKSLRCQVRGLPTPIHPVPFSSQVSQVSDDTSHSGNDFAEHSED